MTIDKKTLFLVLIIGIVAILIIIIAVINLSVSQKQTTPQTSTIPTPIKVQTTQIDSSSPPVPAQGTEYNNSVKKIKELEKQQINHSSMVGKLLNVLPYTGVNFSLTYNYSDNIFTLSLNKQNEAMGNTEFEQFLKQNGIENKSWINNLVIK